MAEQKNQRAADRQQTSTGRVDHPVGKQQYVEEARPTSRVDQPGRPVTVDKTAVPEVTDKTRTSVTYQLVVKSYGKNKSLVRSLILGDRADSLDGLPVTVTASERRKKDLFSIAQTLLSVEADIELKKTIQLEIPII